MPFPADSFRSYAAWTLITRFGEAQLLLPTALVLVGWLVHLGQRHSARLWLGLVLLAAAITTATKIAFIGWGIGSLSLNFSGVSGHAMFAAAVLPLLLYCLVASHDAPTQRNAVVLGYVAAALVAMSRVAVRAHSPSESIAGFVLGGAASALALAYGKVPQQHLPRWLVGVLLAACLLNPVALPTAPTHDMVTRLALWLSGREQPYTRRMLLRREKERQEALRLQATPAPIPAVSAGTPP